MSETIFIAGRSAVVTGAALGIGRAACRRFAELGMSVCLVDLAGDDLQAAYDDVSAVANGGTDSVMMYAADVSDPAQVHELTGAVTARFGSIDVLINNAVTRVGRGAPTNLADWRRSMDVNFWGVVHGVEAVLPAMRASGTAARIVNVGSKQGITNPPGNTIYNVTKSAVKSYTEMLQHELRSNGDGDVCAHLLIPGWTTTGKNEHKPGAWLPAQVVDYLIDAVNAGSFYILCPDDEVSSDMDHRRIRWGAEDIIEDRPPLSRWHPDFKDAAAKACN